MSLPMPGFLTVLRHGDIMEILEVYDLVLAGVPVNCFQVSLLVQGLCDAYKDMVL
ncbi:hypothetical protein DSO57_1030640 [Entomophthora muscae]|uniref:Uncharacterized protein n=1 Tax=Entomophthora muscae TaxID=34485 RepID=A0ACC2SDT5_9FUNG|nr:hypothetical protein DSO57_1030640 [Entomophthora muscae]